MIKNDREDFYMQDAETYLGARRDFEAEMKWKNEVLGPELIQKRRFVKIPSPPIQHVVSMKAEGLYKDTECPIASPPVQHVTLMKANGPFKVKEVRITSPPVQ